MSSRVVKKIFANFENSNDGAVIRQGITKSDHELLDPFVSLAEFSVSPPGGFRDHPHRGEIIFSFLLYILKAYIGGLIHQDFNGNKGTVHEGDVLWTTAGRGIIHSEMPKEHTNIGLQLWVNLPSSDKMIDPANVEISSSEMPVAYEEGAEVKVIAGESMGVQSPFYTRTPIMFLDITLQPGAQTHQAVPESWTAFAYVIDCNEGVFGSSDSSPVQAHTLVVFGTGDEVSVWNTSSYRPLRFFLIAGEPIGESVVQHGPFVMNTQAEIDGTIWDYRNGENGFEKAKYWRSE
ncbi:hypothetical protein Bca52824_077934 [Brassica carinata]|uniref:Pirin-like protein n=1 Tax=Brassica carinata TaxID=52824 RepID=A0A8X7PWV6_BRACI|nr:hypothetical protein Bca52824_077934 [Brassica carinata]